MGYRNPSATTTATGTAVLGGTIRQPFLTLRFPPFLPHPKYPRLTLLEWVKNLPGRRWDSESGTWEVTSLGPRPDQVLADAGFELIIPNGELGDIRSIEQLYQPVTLLASNNRTVLVRCRFAGYEGAQKLIGGAGVWDKKRQLIRMPVSDVLLGASPRPGVQWDPRAVERARQVHAKSPLLHPDVSASAAALANAIDLPPAASSIRTIQDRLGGPVGSFGVDLYPYQIIGAYGVAAGHTLLADSPGVGKSFQGLAAATALRAGRLLIVSPPVVLTNWKRETVRSGFAAEDQVAVFRSGRKEPALDEMKVAVVSDSMLAARPETGARIAKWLCEHDDAIVLVDEAHRMKTLGSQRSDAVLDLVALAPHVRTIALTGTPVLASPHELVPILEFTGHLAPVFGGAGPFLAKFCRQDRFGRWHPRQRALPELNRMLNEHVWVRRTKAQVLPQLPNRSIREVVLDVPLTEYRKAHREIISTIKEWVKTFRAEHGRLPNEAEQEVFAENNLGLSSQLRQAAGLAKVPPAAEIIAEHLAAEPDRPMLVWTHHIAVTEAMHAAAVSAGVPAGVIAGATSDSEKTRLVDEFQAGNIPVLVCSITAAGVGITLTRSSDVLFVESDWTPALMLQAIDRVHRIGQERSIDVRILVAEGTLDEAIQAKLASKGETLEKVLGDTSNSVAVGTDRPLMSAKDIVLGMVAETVAAG